jgi:signal transduction histidine kinase
VKGLSVRIRLTLWYALALTVAMATLTAAMYAAMRGALEADLDANLRYNAIALAERLRYEFDEGDPLDTAADEVVSLFLFHNLLVEIYGPGGERVAASPDLGERRLGSAIDLDAVPSLGDGLARSDLKNDALDDEGVELAAVAVENSQDGQKYVLVAGAGRSPLSNTLSHMRRLAFTLVPLLLLIAVGGGWVLARRALEPAATLARQARRMGADNLGDRLAVPNPDDEIGKLAATFNELLDRIESAFDRMRRFVADASHELRTPVGVIRSGTAVALTPPVTLEECVETLRVIGDQTERLGRLVDDMFVLARADAGDQAILAAVPVPVGELVVSCAAAAARLATASEVTLGVGDIPERERYCVGDRGRLEQMLMNLLTNAIRHAGRNGRVDVDVRFVDERTREVAEITIADTGPGIPEEMREAVFERFVRLDAARTRDTGGSGLGLSIARWVAEAHGGRISVGRSPSGGALFGVSLLLVDADGRRAGPEERLRTVASP